MAQPNLTLIGLENYLSRQNVSVFDGAVFPASIKRDTLISAIKIRSGEFELLYPDPNFLKPAITAWASKWNWTFDKWAKAIEIEYNPLENYDRLEESEDRRDVKTTDLTRTDMSNINTESVAAFNEDDFQPRTNTGSTGYSANSGDLTTGETYKHSARLHGNIGVTTSQQMLQSEIDIARFNLYEQIADIFVSEFCVMVY